MNVGKVTTSQVYFSGRGGMPSATGGGGGGGGTEDVGNYHTPAH